MEAFRDEVQLTCCQEKLRARNSASDHGSEHGRRHLHIFLEDEEFPRGHNEQK